MSEIDNVVTLTRISQSTGARGIPSFDFSVDLSKLPIGSDQWLNTQLFESINNKFLQLRQTDLVFLEIFSNNCNKEDLDIKTPHFMFFADLSRCDFSRLVEFQNRINGDVVDLDLSCLFKLRLHVIKNVKALV